MDSTPIHCITLLRHAQSEGNANQIWQGQQDYPLTIQGRVQVRALVNRWQREDKTFDRIISSPLKRASETAEFIAQQLNIPIEFDSIWQELNNGLYAGLTPDIAQARYPPPELLHPYHPIGNTGESIWELYVRGSRGLNTLMQSPPGSYLVVSHGGILNMVMYAALGIAPLANRNGPHFRFRNTAYATLEYHPDKNQWWLLGINDHEHLSALDNGSEESPDARG